MIFHTKLQQLAYKHATKIITGLLQECTNFVKTKDFASIWQQIGNVLATKSHHLF